MLALRFSPLLLILLGFVPEMQYRDYWRSLSPPTSHDLWSLSFVDSMAGWVVGDSGTILKTTNGGLDWTSQSSGIVYPIVHVFMVDENHGWALAHNYEFDSTMTFGTTFLRTDNGGAQWSADLYQNEFFTSVFFFDSLDGIMAGVFGSIVLTTDGGDSWTPAEVDTSWFSRYPVLGIRFYSRSYGYAVGGSMDIVGVIWRTTDGGLHWESTSVGPEPIHDLHYIDSLNILCVGGDLDYGSGKVRTTNGGESWEYTYLGILGEGRALAFRTPAEGWSPLGFPGTSMHSLDSGATWSDQYTPDSSGVYDVQFTDSLTGYMVGKRGTILKYDPPPVHVAPGPRSIEPQTTTLYQNYPNPFNPSTEIGYRIAGTERVVIKVFDITGREVALLVDERQGPGEYSVLWDGSAVAAGIYFCQLKSGDFVLKRKMLLVK